MEIRPMQERDMAAVHAVAVAAFRDLNERTGDAPYTGSSPEAAEIRYRRLLAADPGGAWVAERAGVVTGAALALLREGLWGLSLLAVAPEAQSAGVGRELLARAWAYGAGARAHLILASRDPRALRAYVRLGLDLHPALEARGRPRDVPPVRGVRRLEDGDRAWADDLARTVRGAAHGADLDALLASGHELRVLPGRGYLAARGGELRLLAAADADAASTLLHAHLLAAAGAPIAVDWITSAQQWAVRACVGAGLALHAHGAVMTGGLDGPPVPYLPSGPFL